MRKRRALNMTERAATALLQIKRGDGSWLIPEPLRSSGTAAEIVRSVDWDHKHPHALGGTNDPQNMQPLSAEEHAYKTKRDVRNIAKAKRQTKKQEEFCRQLLAKETGELTYEKPKKRKQYMPCGRNSKWKRKIYGTVVPR